MNTSFILMAYITMFVVGAIIGIVVGVKEPTINTHHSVLTKKEYEKFLSQSKQSAAIAHGGGKLCPDKTLFEVICNGAENSNFKFPDLSDL